MAYAIQTKIDDEMLDLMRDVGLLEVGACIQCGTCSGSCPSGRRTAIKTRAIIKSVVAGDTSVLSDPGLWACTTCYTCTERCPRAIPITDVIVALRNAAVRRGYTLSEHLQLCFKLYDTGHGVPIDNEKWNKLREAYGLSYQPPTVHSHPKALEELQVLLCSTGFDKITNLNQFDESACVKYRQQLNQEG